MTDIHPTEIKSEPLTMGLASLKTLSMMHAGFRTTNIDPFFKHVDTHNIFACNFWGSRTPRNQCIKIKN